MKVAIVGRKPVRLFCAYRQLRALIVDKGRDINTMFLTYDAIDVQ